MPSVEELIIQGIEDYFAQNKLPWDAIPQTDLKNWTERHAESRATEALNAGTVGANEMAAPPPWIVIGATGAPAFQNSWVNFSSTFAQAAFYKDHLGTVHLRGLIKSGTVTAAAFTLPAGYRPVDATASLIYAVASNDAFGEVRVEPDGDVIPQIGSNGWFSLNGIYFRVRQENDPAPT